MEKIKYTTTIYNSRACGCPILHTCGVITSQSEIDFLASIFPVTRDCVPVVLRKHTNSCTLLSNLKINRLHWYI